MPLKKLAPSNRRLGFAIIAVASVSIALASCQTSAESVQFKENDLAGVGFVARPENTPARVAMPKRLPPNKILIRGRVNTVNYVYADPVDCNCLYVGTQKAYSQYRQTQIQERIANRQLWAAQAYGDANWDWSGWALDYPYFDGPYGPAYGW